MVRDLRLNIVSSSEGDGVEEAVAGLEALAVAADNAGEEMREAARDASHLNRQLEESRRRARELADEFDRTGDAGVMRQFQRERGLTRRLESVARHVTPSGNGNGALPLNQVGRLESLASGAATGTPSTGVAIAAGAVIAAPAIGAAIGSAILLAVGGGALATGIALAANDPKVESAFGDLGAGIMDKLGDDASVFVAPLVDAAHVLRDVFDRNDDSTGRMFSMMARAVDPLVRGFGGFVDGILPGLERGVEAALPIVVSLGQELPRMGRAFAYMFDEIAEGGPGATRFFVTMLRWLDGTVMMIGWTIGALSKMYDKMASIGDWLDKKTFGLIPALSESKKAGDDASDTLDKFGDAAKSAFDAASGGADDATRSVKDLSAAIDALMDRQLAAEHAAIGWERAFDALTDSVKENGRSLDITTEKGRANREAMLSGIEAARAARAANISNGMSIADANKMYDEELAKLKARAVQLGLNKKLVDALVGTYIVEINYVYRGTPPRSLSPGDIPTGRIGGLADGGPFRAGDVKWVGEEGPELAVFGDNGFIIPSDVARGGTAGGGMGAMVGPMRGGTHVILSAADPQARWLLNQLRVDIRDEGGDVQQVLGANAGM